MRSTPAIHPLFAIAALLSGCAGQPAPEGPAATGTPGLTDDTGNGMDGQFGEEDTGLTYGTTGGCVLASATALTTDEETELGFSADALIDVMAGEWAETLRWETGSETPLLHTLTYVEGSALFNVYSPGAASDTASSCGPTVSVALEVSFATDDGAFDESWSVVVETDSVAQPSYRLLLDTVSGTATVGDGLLVEAFFDGGDHWGAITAYGTDTWQPEDTAADGGITQTVDTLARW